MQRKLPNQPSLEWLRRQAKDLLRQLRQSQVEALSRFQAAQPSFKKITSPQISEQKFVLHQAQLVIAREHGFASWVKMKQEVERLALDSRVSEPGGEQQLILRDFADVLKTSGTKRSVLTMIEGFGERFVELHQDRKIVCIAILRNHRPDLVDASPSQMFSAPLPKEESRELAARYFGFSSWSNVVDNGGILLDPDFEAAVEAVVTGDVSKLRTLFDKSPGLIADRSSFGHRSTLLHYVAANGVEIHRQFVPDNAVEIARFLLDQGADPDALCETYGGGLSQTPLCLLISSGHPDDAGLKVPLVEVLLDHGADVNGVTKSGLPLGTAVSFGCSAVAQVLVQRGAVAPDLKTAAGAGMAADVGRLLGLDSDKTELGEALYLASRNGFLEIVRRLIEAGAEISSPGLFGGTALHWAAIGGHEAIVRLLVDEGSDPNLCDTRFGANAAGWANESKKTAIRDWLLDHGCHASIVQCAAFERIDLVVERIAAKPDCVNENVGRTALHEAAGRGHLEMAALLLKHGADPLAVDLEGRTPIDWAERSKQTKMVALLKSRLS